MNHLEINYLHRILVPCNLVDLVRLVVVPGDDDNDLVAASYGTQLAGNNASMGIENERVSGTCGPEFDADSDGETDSEMKGLVDSDDEEDVPETPDHELSRHQRARLSAQLLVFYMLY